MASFDQNTIERKAVARYAWLLTAAILVLFVIIPFAYINKQKVNDSSQFNATVNTIELIGIGGCMSGIAFFAVALMFRASSKANSNRSPIAMRKSLNQGIILTLIYWVFFIALTQTGGDGDGIMRGWMVILYPIVLVSYVLHASRASDNHNSSQ